MNTTTTTITATTGRLSLKTVLLLDAAVTGTNGLAYVAGAGFLDSLLGPSTDPSAGHRRVPYGVLRDSRHHRHPPAHPARMGDVRVEVKSPG